MATYRRIYLAGIRIGALLLLFCAVAGCGEGTDTFEVEVDRVRSPDGKVDAVLTRLGGGGGATVGYLWWVYLVPAGVPISNRQEPIIRATHVAPKFGMMWDGTHLLNVTYHKAVFSHFKNIWYGPRSNETWEDRVEVRLRHEDAYSPDED